MNRLLMSSLVLIALVLFGCSDDTDPGRDLGPGPDAKVVPDRALTETSKPDANSSDKLKPDMARYAQVCGYLEDVKGIKLGGMPLIMCNEHECNTDTSGSTGTFCLSTATADDFMVHVSATKASGKQYTDVMFPVTITAADVSAEKKQDVGKVIVPESGAVKTLDPKNGGTYDLGSGISLSVGAGATTLPPLTSSAELGAVAVAVSHLHAKLTAQKSGLTPVAAFAFIPIEIKFSPAATFKLPGTGLKTGASLEGYWVDEETGLLKKHVDAQVDTSGAIVNVSGQGISRLGWFLFYSK